MNRMNYAETPQNEMFKTNVGEIDNDSYYRPKQTGIKEKF